MQFTGEFYYLVVWKTSLVLQSCQCMEILHKYVNHTLTAWSHIHTAIRISENKAFLWRCTFLHIAKHTFSLVLKLFLLGHGNSRMKWTKAVKGSALEPARNIRSGLFSHKIGSGYGPKVVFASDVCERVEIHALSPFFSWFAWEHLWWAMVPE